MTVLASIPSPSQGVWELGPFPLRAYALCIIAGIVVAGGYMLGSAVLTPALWIDPLGALVKTGPAIVLMMVALAISDDR